MGSATGAVVSMTSINGSAQAADVGMSAIAALQWRRTQHVMAAAGAPLTREGDEKLEIDAERERERGQLDGMAVMGETTMVTLLKTDWKEGVNHP